MLKDLSEGEYSLTIKAMAKSGSKILNSQASEEISFTIDGSGDISGTKYNVVLIVMVELKSQRNLYQVAIVQVSRLNLEKLDMYLFVGY